MLHLLKNMVKYLLSTVVAKNKALLLYEAEKISGFMKLLMKPINTRYRWTKEEKKMLRMHLWHLSYYIPALMIFALPFGAFLFPVLAEILDRRGNKRNGAKKSGGNNHNHLTLES